MRMVIFGGTTEGRELWERYHETDSVLVSVTTAYAASLMPGAETRIGKLDQAGMVQLLQEFGAEKVLDATHPYALEASENIREACRITGIPLERIHRARSEGDWREMVIPVRNTEEAIRQLREMEGNILLTTGMKTLKQYTEGLPVSRIYARILPDMHSLTAAEDAGIPGNRILAMQGPFSEVLNGALYDLWNIRILVTKDSGRPGGVEEKVIPALERGIQVILIVRPEGEKE